MEKNSTLAVKRTERNLRLSPTTIAWLMNGSSALMLSSIKTGATFSPPAVIRISCRNNTNYRVKTKISKWASWYSNKDLKAASDEHQAALIHVTDVARMEVTFGIDRFRSVDRVVQVAHENVSTAHQNLLQNLIIIAYSRRFVNSKRKSTSPLPSLSGLATFVTAPGADLPALFTANPFVKWLQECGPVDSLIP